MPLTHPIARTAFYCATLRADDAARPNPVCGDSFAARFLDDETRRPLLKLLSLSGPTASNVARHRIIDDLLRERLALNPALRVILLGAGFDTRAYRLPGGRWWEVDDPELLAYKEERLPAREAPNPLVRLPIHFATESLAERLKPLAGDDEVVVVMEGVSMYLDDTVLTEAMTTIRRTFPRATLLVDLQSTTFRRRYAARVVRELAALGAHFVERSRHPAEVIEGAGFRVKRRFSVLDRAREAGTFRIPRWLLATLLRGLRDGYAIWEFEPAD